MMFVSERMYTMTNNEVTLHPIATSASLLVVVQMRRHKRGDSANVNMAERHHGNSDWSVVVGRGPGCFRVFGYV